jgi:ribosomal protein S18 acetylase RimI-like enzyme
MSPAAASSPPTRTQSSIRSFFQPRQPSYAAPPATATRNAPTPTPQPSYTSLPVISPPLSEVGQETPLASREAVNIAPRSSIPRQARISGIGEEHILPLKRINALLLPVNYPESFYQKILDPTCRPNFSRVVLWQDDPVSQPKVVGGLVCRVEVDEENRQSAVYIQSLGVLSPFRQYGLATALVEDVVRSLVNMPLGAYPVTSIYAHVWTENPEALGWYLGRGFLKDEQLIMGYYRRLQPGNAWLLRRAVTPRDYLGKRLKPNGVAGAVSATTVASPTVSAGPPPPTTTASRPGLTGGKSYQIAGPGHEWNDLPEEMVIKPPSLSSSQSLLVPDSEPASGASSRSSSSNRAGKKKRQYPAAAFGIAGAGN